MFPCALLAVLAAPAVADDECSEYWVALGRRDAAAKVVEAAQGNQEALPQAYEAVRKANEVLNGARWAVWRTIDEPSARAVLHALDSAYNAVRAASEALAAWHDADVSRALREGTDLRTGRIGIDTQIRMGDLPEKIWAARRAFLTAVCHARSVE